MLCLLASAAVRIPVFCCGEQLGLWPYLLLPVVSTVWFALKAIFAGEERLYQTAVPIWLMGIAIGWQSFLALEDTPFLWVMVCIAIRYFLRILFRPELPDEPPAVVEQDIP